VKSSHSLRFKQEARWDIRDIRRYSERRFGEHQRDRYLAKLDAAFQKLQAFPGLGVAREDLATGCRGLIVEEHIVFYRIVDSEIVVGRVLSTSQEPAGKVKF
jgi:toxin ParE1/3/4